MPTLLKNRRKDTSKIENGIKLSSKIEESAASTSKGSAWNKWLSSETPSLIAVVGQSCAGKSNLAKMILRSQIMRTFQYRFYISLKGNSKKELNLLEFLTQKKLALNWIENPSLDKTTYEIYQKVIDKLRYEKVCIVFDDIGIGSFAFDKDEIEPSYFRKQFANQFFSSILNKELLCKAKVVIVLNHWEYEHVILQLQPEAYKLVHVFGIDQDDQIRMAESSLCHVETCCAYNEVKKNVAILDVGVHSEFHNANECVLCDNHDLCDCADEIQLLLNVPIHCRSFLEHCSSCTKGCRIANACYLLLKWLQYIVKIYPKTSYCLNEVGKFAWNKYIQDTFLFTFEDLKSLSKTERNIFFVSLCNIQATEKDLLYRFSSILLQDFLAAVWCLSLSNDEIEYNKQKFKQWNNSALVIAFMKEISQMHQQFRLDPSLNVNHENVLKVEKYCPKSKTNSNPTSVSEYVRRWKSNFNFF